MRSRRRLLPEDIAEQTVGALLLSGGLILPGDVWIVAAGMDFAHAIAALGLVVGTTALAQYAAADKSARRKGIRALVPRRLLTSIVVASLVAVCVAVGLELPARYDASTATVAYAVVVSTLVGSLAAALLDEAGE